MNLKSKFKKISILSVVVMNTLLLSGGLTTNAMNPQSSNGPTSNVVFPYSNSIINCVSQSTKQLGVEPIAIFARKLSSIPRGEIEIGIPQVILSSNAQKLEVVRQRIKLEGKLIPTSLSDSVSNASTVKILAYVPSKERLKERLFNEPLYIYIPQVICREGVTPWLTLAPQPINFVGMLISADNPALKIQQSIPSGSSKIIAPQRGSGQYNESPQKKLMDAQANQAHAASLNSSEFLPIPSSVKLSNDVQKNHEPSVSKNSESSATISKSEESNNPSAETPQSSTPLLSEQTEQTNCVTPEKNKLSAKEMEKIGSLAPRPVRRYISKFSCDEIRELSKKLDFSQDESERQNTSASPKNAHSEQKNSVTSERNKLSLQKSVSKSNGVQKTTMPNSRKPIHREAKKNKKIVENNSPIYINLSDSQSDIETDIDTDIEENSDYNKK